jgi:hypothetical protein
MIKIALGVYDALEITIGPRSPSKFPIEKWSAFERYKPSYCSVITLGARTNIAEGQVHLHARSKQRHDVCSSDGRGRGDNLHRHEQRGDLSQVLLPTERTRAAIP